MNVFTVAFLAYLLYVSYCKIVWLCFRGRVHNRFFAACVSTVIPVFGSIPAYIIATKYERRVGAVAPKMNGEALRLSMILLQMASCFVLFLPFLAKHGVYANGINYVYGLSVAGEIIIPELKFLSYLIIAPFVSAVINCIDIKYNIRNVITYIVSLICCLTVFILSMFFYFSEDYVMEYGMWLYCTINLTVMLLSIFSLIKVRNKFLLNLEETEMNEMVEMQKQKAMKPEQETIPQGSYKCAKCGNYVTKGEICSCRKNSAPTLNSVMIEQNKKKTSDFCVYCRRALKPDEKCNCIGEGFAITVKPEQFNGRKCSYCGKILVGDGTCVCEKIMTKSVPSSPEDGTIATKKPPLKVYTQPTHDISAEMAELEAKINKKFESIKDSLTKGGSINSNDTNDNSKN